MWNQQKKVLDGTAVAPDWRYLGFIADSPDHDARDHIASKLITSTHGKIMSVSHQQKVFSIGSCAMIIMFI